MRKLICLFVLAALAVPALADLKDCDPAKETLKLDASTPAWSHQLPVGKCFDIDVEPPAGQACSYGTSLEEVVPGPFVASAVTSTAAARVAAAADEGVTPIPPPEIGPYELGECEALKIRVQCPAVAPAPAIDTTYTVTTGQCGRWVTHYGVGFLDDENGEFFTSAVTDEMGMTTGFEIKAEADNRSDYNTELVVTFTYLPAGGRWRLKDFGRLGFLGGVGADLDERLVFAGLSWIWGENVNLFVAAAGHMRTHLDGQYEIGQILKQDLTPDKLTEDTFSVDLIFGAAFRFDSNPFKKKPTG